MYIGKYATLESQIYVLLQTIFYLTIESLNYSILYAMDF